MLLTSLLLLIVIVDEDIGNPERRFEVIPAESGRLGILNDFTKSKTCSLFEEVRSGIKGMTESEVGTCVGIGYLGPLLYLALLLLLIR